MRQITTGQRTYSSLRTIKFGFVICGTRVVRETAGTTAADKHESKVHIQGNISYFTSQNDVTAERVYSTSNTHRK